MHPHNKGDRKWVRYVKGMRRVHEDRAEHGSDHSCDCFEANGHGRVFDRFADTPQMCSSLCCGNMRQHYGNSKNGLTVQERRHAWEGPPPRDDGGPEGGFLF